ncbi:MAG: PQQ-dependent sugar dehydrogenase [Burkholderiales bacterium]
MPVVSALLWVVTAVAVSSCAFVQDWRDEKKGIQLESLKVPSGYQVAVFATGLPKARHMALGTQGTLFVGSSGGNVYALSLTGSVVSNRRIVVKGLTDPSGVAFYEGALYVADRTRIVRFEKIEEHLDKPGEPSTVIDGLPDKARHGARAMSFGPDGKLYVSVGSPCNSCEAKNDEYGTILRSNPDGSGKEVFARGLRNSDGFDWHPQTQELWFTENGQDELGPERPNDELNRVGKVGENFGFPYCHDVNIPDPKFGSKHGCGEFTAPLFGLGAHTAALGMRFDTTEKAPGQVSLLIARHGSHPPIRVGYDVVRIQLLNGQPERIEPFLIGFLQGRSYWGRPVDVVVMRDGSVLVSDDLNGAIYRVARQR